jgi:hypothetical protein
MHYRNRARMTFGCLEIGPLSHWAKVGGGTYRRCGNRLIRPKNLSSHLKYSLALHDKTPHLYEFLK